MTSTTPSLRAWSNSVSMAMYVPVRPMPALQDKREIIPIRDFYLILEGVGYFVKNNLLITISAERQQQLYAPQGVEEDRCEK